MKVRGVKLNYVLNITRTVLSTLIGLFTLPYINRVLGVEALGKFEYANSIISYFVLFSALGIPMYGIREIARVRDSEYNRSKVTAELLVILGITTIISYVLLFGFLIHLDFLQDYKVLIFVLAPTIFLSNFGFEWFFQGIEDQMYITIRFIVIKIITLILLFTLVKSPEDYVAYALIMVISTVGANLFNLIYIRKFLNFKILKRKDIEFKKHLKGIITIFLATVSISIYLQLDNTLLGVYGGDKHVGIYATANKLVRFAILFVTTLGAVLLPRLSYFYENKKYDDYNLYLNKSLKYILFFSLPICSLIFGLADRIILVMAGSQFVDAIVPMKILSFLLLIIGIAYYLAFMVMYPQGKERLYTLLVFVSAVISVILNIIFIPKYFELATSVVSVIVELIAIIFMIFFLRKQLVNYGFFSIKNLNYIIGAVLVYFVINLVQNINLGDMLTILIGGLLGTSVYLVFLLIVKDYVIIESIQKLKIIYEKKK